MNNSFIQLPIHKKRNMLATHFLFLGKEKTLIFLLIYGTSFQSQHKTFCGPLKVDFCLKVVSFRKRPLSQVSIFRGLCFTWGNCFTQLPINKEQNMLATHFFFLRKEKSLIFLLRYGTYFQSQHKIFCGPRNSSKNAHTCWHWEQTARKHCGTE